MQQQPTQRRRKILLVGLTGSGKSSVGNWIIDGQLFKEGDGAEAVTVQTVSENGTFDNVLEVEVIDSPGLQDPMGRDVAHVTAMVEHVKARGEIDLVLLVLNFWKPRFDATLQSMLRIFFKMFRHANMWDNFGIVFTRCYVEQLKESEKEAKRSEFCGKVRSFVDSLGAKMACNPPCFFVDTHPEGNDQPTRNERAMLAGLLASLSPMTTCDMEDPGEYQDVEEETQMVITERNSTPVFEKHPIIEKIPLLGKKSGFKLGFGGFSLEFGGGSKVVGYKEVNCGSVSQLAGHTVTEKGVLMKREKRTWYDGKTVSYSPWEVVDNFATDKTEKA